MPVRTVPLRGLKERIWFLRFTLAQRKQAENPDVPPRWKFVLGAFRAKEVTIATPDE